MPAVHLLALIWVPAASQEESTKCWEKQRCQNGPRTFLLSIKPREGRGGNKGGFGRRPFAHVQRCTDELPTSQNRKYHPLKLDVERSEELCETVPPRMEKSFLQQIPGDFWENWLTHWFLLDSWGDLVSILARTSICSLNLAAERATLQRAEMLFRSFSFTFLFPPSLLQAEPALFAHLKSFLFKGPVEKKKVLFLPPQVTDFEAISRISCPTQLPSTNLTLTEPRKSVIFNLKH